MLLNCLPGGWRRARGPQTARRRRALRRARVAARLLGGSEVAFLFAVLVVEDALPEEVSQRTLPQEVSGVEHRPGQIR